MAQKLTGNQKRYLAESQKIHDKYKDLQSKAETPEVWKELQDKYIEELKVKKESLEFDSKKKSKEMEELRIENGKFETWTRAAHVSGFPDWQATLQFEWRWKQLTRKLPVNMVPLERRILALKMLIELPQSTSKAKPYSEWPSPPEVHLEIDDAKTYYEKT